jgi:seryl-tRNA synthetase
MSQDVHQDGLSGANPKSKDSSSQQTRCLPDSRPDLSMPGRDAFFQQPPAMTLKTVLEYPDLVKQACADKGHVVDIDRLVQLEIERRGVQQEIEGLRAESNRTAKNWQNLDSAGRDQAKTLRARLGAAENRYKEMAAEVEDLFNRVPNFLAPDVPRGPETANLQIRAVGEIPSFDFEPRSHKDLCEGLGLVDFEGGSKVTGRGFYYMEGELFLMRQAIAMMFISHLAGQGFIPGTTPLMANSRTLFGTGYLPWAIKDNFKIEGGDLALIGTSEQTLLGKHLDDLMNIDDLPICYVADTQCFRTEVGAAGVDTKGLMRVHQFGKVEQIIVCRPEESERWHEAALANEEWLLQKLGLPYRVMLLASEDVGAPGYKKFDIEGWFPFQNQFRELTSNTNFRDFQSRRLNMRCKGGETKEKVFPHTISATGFSDRLLVALMENYQNANGSITVPSALVPHVGKSVITGERIKPRLH